MLPVLDFDINPSNKNCCGLVKKAHHLFVMAIWPILFSSFMEAPLLSVESLTLLYSNLKSVIPAKAGIQVKKTGFRITSGMTKCIITFLRHYIRNVYLFNPDREKSQLKTESHKVRQPQSAFDCVTLIER